MKTIEKQKSNSVIVLALGSMALDFLIAENTGIIYPRDRLVHILISSAIAVLSACIINAFNNKNVIIGLISLIIIFCRCVYICNGYIKYFRMFHGANTMVILLFTFLVVVFFWRFIYKKAQDLYMFFMIINMFAVVLIFVLALDKVNVANIYANDISVNLNTEKLFVFFDFIAIYFLIDEKKQRTKTTGVYIISGVLFAFGITVLQGLCIRGNVLYNISPLQALIQVFSTKTIMRFDYIFTIWGTLVYFGAVMLYMWVIKNILNNIKEIYCEKI